MSGALEFDVALARGAFCLEAAGELTGETWGLFGPSASGKSTLLSVVAGLLRPDRGRVVLDGEVLLDTERGAWVPPHERGIALVFQDALLFPHLDVAGNLRFGADRMRRAGAAPGFDEVCELLELRALLDRRPTELSGGEARRVALGRALLSAPRLILLDEPLVGLDAPRRRQALAFLARVRDRFDVPLLYVSHDLSEVLELTRRLMLIEDGEIVARGPLLELLRSEDALPRLLHRGLTNVFELTVAATDPVTGLTRLTGRGAEVFGPPASDEPGARVFASLRPEDVTLCLDRVPATSARNQLEGTVTELHRDERRYLVRVDAGLELLVEVSPGAVAELGLKPGRRVWCLFKSNALELLAT